MRGYLIVFLGAGMGGAARHGINVAAGILGGFTTSSAFSLNAVLQYERGQ
jgi:fluoride ion exporter CrcB/FEX